MEADSRTQESAGLRHDWFEVSPKLCRNGGVAGSIHGTMQLYCKSTFFCKSRRFRRKGPICPAIRLEKDRQKNPRLYRSSKWMVNLLTEINFEPGLFERGGLMPRRNRPHISEAPRCALQPRLVNLSMINRRPTIVPVTSLPEFLSPQICSNLISVH